VLDDGKHWSPLMKSSKILTTFFLAALASAAACGSDEPTKATTTTTATGAGGANTGGAGGAGGAGGTSTSAGGATPGLGIDAAPAAAVAASVDFAKPVSTSVAAGPFVFTLFEDKDCGLLDLTDPELPLDRGVIATSAHIVAVAYDEGNQLAYLASADGDLQVIDLSNVEQPAELAKLTVSSLKGGLTGLTRVGDRLFALAGNLLQPLGIERDPVTKVVTKLALQAPITLAGPATVIEAGGGNLFLGDSTGNLQILSAPSGSTKPAVLGQIALGGPIKGLVVRGSKVLGVASGVGLKAVDFVDVKAPKLLFESDEVKDASDVRLFGRTLVLGLDRGAVTTLDISKIDAPRAITTNTGKLPQWMAISRGQLFFGDKTQGKVFGIPPFIGGRLAGPTLTNFPLKGFVPITFSKDIDIATVSPDSVKLFCGGEAVKGSPAVLPQQHTLIFRPTAPLPAGVSCKLDVTGVRDRLGNAVSAGGDGAAMEFTTDKSDAKPITNPGSKFKHTTDGKFTDLGGGQNAGEWSDVTAAKGMYTYFYADFDGSKLWLMNDWFYGGENIEPDCYNQFNVWTGGGSEQWDVRAYGDQHVEVRKNGVLLDPKEGGIEGGASYTASPNLVDPHTMYEIAVPASPGAWGVQLHDPGPTFNCHVLAQEPHPMQGSLSADGDNSTTTIDLAQPEPPKAIQLQFPQNGMTMSPPVKLMWGKGDGFDFTMYQVQVSTDETFAYKSRILDVGTYLSEVNIPSGLLKEGATYYWHVIAWNTAGSTTSEAYSFKMMGGGGEGGAGGGGNGGGGTGGGTTTTSTSSGSCINTPCQLSGAEGVSALAVFQGSAYFYQNDPGTIQKMSTNGGAVTPVVGTNALRSLAVDGTAVYWNSGSYMGTVQKVALGGGLPETLATATGYPTSLAIDGTSVYFVDEYEGESAIRKVGKAGGTVTALTGYIQVPSAFLLMGNLYWANGGGISTVGTDGAGQALLFPGASATSLAFLEKQLYWTSPPDAIRFGSYQGGAATDWIAGGEPSASSLIAVGGYLYWFTNNVSGSLRYAPWSQPSQSLDLALNLVNPRGLTTDGTYLYWAADNGIWRIALPAQP
jgi:hypothetical protein